jgi:hypothetical protein
MYVPPTSMTRRARRRLESGVRSRRREANPVQARAVMAHVLSFSPGDAVALLAVFGKTDDVVDLLFARFPRRRADSVV